MKETSLYMLGLKSRGKAAMLVDKTIQFFLVNQHGYCDILCKPEIDCTERLHYYPESIPI